MLLLLLDNVGNGFSLRLAKLFLGNLSSIRFVLSLGDVGGADEGANVVCVEGKLCLRHLGVCATGCKSREGRDGHTKSFTKLWLPFAYILQRSLLHLCRLLFLDGASKEHPHWPVCQAWVSLL